MPTENRSTGINAPIGKCDRVLVEKYFLGEGADEEKRGMRRHLDGCADCRDRMATLDIERRDYLMTHPFRDFAAKRLPSGKSGKPARAATLPPWLLPRWLLPRWLPALAGVAVCLMLLPFLSQRLDLARNGAGADAGGEEAVRMKGGPILEFYCKRDGKVQAGQASETYLAGDELQFVYGGGGYAYVTLASVDSRGKVSLYRAEGESLAVSLPAKPGERQTLPFGVTLDDSPGAELFVLVYGSQPLTGSALESWLQGAFTRASGNLATLAGALPAPPGAHSVAKGLLLGKAKG